MRKKLAVLFALFALLGAGACTQQDDAAEDETDTATEAEELGDDEFRLVGTVIEARHRAQPPGGLPEEVAPETEEDEEADADTEDDPGVGGMAIRPENDDDAEGLDDCETTQDAYVAYYVEDTTWDPEDVVDDEDFPVGLAGQTVDVEGRIFTAEDEDEAGDLDATDDPEASPEAEDEESPAAAEDEDTDAEDEGCILVLDEVEVTEDVETGTGTDDDGTSPGVGGTDEGDDDESPAPTGDDADETADPDATPPTGGVPGGIFSEEGASPDPCEGRKACAEKEAEGELPE